MSSFKTDFRNSCKLLKHLRERLSLCSDELVREELVNLVHLLDSPLFVQLVSLQDTLAKLKSLSLREHLAVNQFDIDAKTGELVLLSDAGDIRELSEVDEASSLELATGDSCDSLYGTIKNLARGRMVETVVLQKTDDSHSLGFSIIGQLGRKSSELGIFVKDIQPEGLAAKNGRIQENDQILAINGHAFDESISNAQAIQIIQQAKGRIELIVARGSPLTTDWCDASISPFDQEVSSALTDTSQDMVLSSEWTQLEVIHLINDGSGLGFGIIGGKSTGVVVKTILPGGVADRDGRLRSGDHILQIGDINVRGLGSEQVASVLRQSCAEVRLIVARGVLEPTEDYPAYAPIIPTQQLSEHINQLNAFLSAYPNYQSNPDADPMALLVANELFPAEVHKLSSDAISIGPEVEYFDVELVKDDIGLGITVVGYFSEKSIDDLSGIFVQSIAEGSAAALDGRIQINDQIVSVDSQPLNGFTNQQAVELLRKTQHVVHLKLARYRYGPKHEQLQRCSTQATESDLSSHQDFGNFISSQVVQVDDFGGELSTEIEENVIQEWRPIIGDNFDIIVAQVSKFKEGGGLGISLEGTVDVENGVEVHPHHYIRSVLADGPVGMNGRLRSGDELLEVNKIRLLGLNHVEVVTILKELPQNVRIVCARRRPLNLADYVYAPTRDQFFQIPSPPIGFSGDLGQLFGDRLVKAKSEQILPLSTVAMSDVPVNRLRSRSLEPLTGMGMWSDDLVVIELEKGDKGLGFSILDYQDPINPDETVIVIRSLVPGGVAQLDNRLFPGDRLMFVNDVSLEHATLDVAVQALKGAPRGTVILGVTKPLPLPGVREGGHTDDIIIMESEEFVRSSDHLVDLNSVFISMPSNVTPPSSQRFQSPPLNPLNGSPSWNQNIRGVASCSSVWTTIQIRDGDVSSVGAHPHSRFAQNKNSPSVASPLDSPSEGFNSRVSTVGLVDHSTMNSRLKNNLDLTDISIGSLQSSNDSLSPVRNISEKPELPSARISTDDLNLVGVPSAASSPPSSSSKQSSHEHTSGKPELPPKPKTIFKSPVHFDRKFETTSSVIEVSSPSNAASSFAQVIVSQMTSPCPDAPPSVAAAVVPSTSLTRCSYNNVTTVSHHVDETYPRSLEQTIKIHKGNDPLGIVVESSDKGINGCVVKSITSSDAIAKDGRIKVGDFILSVNSESMRRVTNAQARAILRRSSLLGTDICITFISASELAKYFESAPEVCESQTASNIHAKPSTIRGVNQVIETKQNGIHRASSSKSHISSMDSIPQSAHSCSNDKTSCLPVDAKFSKIVNGLDISDQINNLYSSLAGDIHRIMLITNSEGLGLRLAGDRDPKKMAVYVAGIVPESVAALDGRIWIGDQLLQINDQVLYGRSHLNAPTLIKSVSSSELTILLLRRPENAQCMAVPPFTSVFQSKVDPSTNFKAKTHIPSKNDDPVEKGAPMSTPVCLSVASSTVNAVPVLNSTTATNQTNTHLVASGSTTEQASSSDISSPSKLDIDVTAVDTRSSDLCSNVESHHIDENILRINDQDSSSSCVIQDLGSETVKKIADETLNVDCSKKELSVAEASAALETNSRTDNNNSCQLAGVNDTGQNESLLTDIDVKTSIAKNEADNEKIGEDKIKCVDRDEPTSSVANQISMPSMTEVVESNRIVNPKDPYQSNPATIDKSLPEQNCKRHVKSKENEAKKTSGSSGSETRRRSKNRSCSSANNDPTTCRIIPGRETLIEIQKGNHPLGLDIIGGINTLLGVVIVHEIFENGAASRDGRLSIGDQILEVNDEDFREVTDDWANEILRQMPPVVRLLVYRDEIPFKEDDIYEIFSVDLLKKPGRGLGISIVCRDNCNGIFISDIIKGSVADSDGQLAPGDQILVVNDIDLRNVTHLHAAEMLKTLMGRVSLTIGRVKCLSRSTSPSNSSLTGINSDDDLPAVHAKDLSRDRSRSNPIRDKLLR